MSEILEQNGGERLTCPKCGNYKKNMIREVKDTSHIIHDYPVIYEPTDTTVLEAGMVLAIEPFAVVGAEKYAIEDDVLVTEDGVELLSGYMDTEEMWPIAA